ncbi:MAG: sugar MFS transporter [Acidobacteriota bacterium]|jgi:FHS family L-fucose permease-like MFS transporter
MATRSTPQATASAPSYLGPFITVTILFGAFGFLTNLNSNLMPQLKSIFNLSYGPAMAVTVAWFFAYLVFSVPSARLIEAVGYKRTMVISLFIMTLGALLFVPAARMVSFALFMTAIFVLAAGVTALQTSANPYVSILGPDHSAPARLTLAQAFNSLGAALAPLVVVHFILTNPSKTATPASIAETVQGPYVAIAVALLVLGIAVIFMHLPAITSARPSHAGDGSAAGPSIWKYRHTVLGMVGIFFYVGIEIALAAIAISFFRTQGIDNKDTVAFLALLYYLLIGAGRFVGTLLMKWIKAHTLLAILGFLGMALLFAAMFTHGDVAAWSLVLCGVANSIMYPTIFALGIAELGPMTSKGSGIITMGNFGGAVIPVLMGALADKVGIQHAFIVPIVCYLFVAYYGFAGYKPTRPAAA